MIQLIYFTGKPKNYSKIDDVVSRSAQPQKEDFSWLKKQGVTDIFNFRTMTVSGLNFDEKQEVENLGMKYHNIPSITNKPNENNIDSFLRQIDKVKQNVVGKHIFIAKQVLIEQVCMLLSINQKIISTIV